MTDDFAGQPTYDILAANEPEPKRRPARLFVVGGVVVLVAALIGGISYGAASLSGGGAQPADVLPAGAAAYASVDLDPAAGQKLDAIRFLRKFPSLRGHLAEGADLRKVLFESVAADAGWSKVDFAHDVEPWLGQRVGVAAYSPKTLGSAAGSGGRSPSTVVVALQVSDAGKAKDGLNRLIAASKGSIKPGYVVRDGYALLAESTPLAKAAADLAGKGSMATSATFTADIKGLDHGIATFWIDGSAASSLTSVADLAGVALPGIAGVAGAGGQGSALSKARLVSSLRFDGPDVLELVGRVRGAPKTGGPNVPVQDFAKLPSTTVAALGLGGGDGAVDGAWNALRNQIDSTPAARDSFNNGLGEAEGLYGLHLPADLKVLLGSNFLVALDSAGLADGKVGVGARVTTADPQRADKVISRLTQSLSGFGGLGGLGGQQITHRATADGYVVASSAAQANRLTRPSAKTLGGVPAFRRALPDIAAARFVLWLDVQGVLAALPAGAADSADLKPISGLGVTSTSDGAGNGTFRLRLVTR